MFQSNNKLLDFENFCDLITARNIKTLNMFCETFSDSNLIINQEWNICYFVKDELNG